MAKLPSLTSDIPNDLRQWCERVREALEASGLVTAITEPPQAALAAPSDLRALMSNETLTLTWSNPTAAAQIEVWEGASSLISSARLIQTTTGTVFIKPAATEEVHYYWVRAVSADGRKSSFNAQRGTKAEPYQSAQHYADLLKGMLSGEQIRPDSLGAEHIARFSLSDAAFLYERGPDPGTLTVTAKPGAQAIIAMAFGYGTSNEPSVSISLDGVNIDAYGELDARVKVFEYAASLTVAKNKDGLVTNVMLDQSSVETYREVEFLASACSASYMLPNPSAGEHTWTFFTDSEDTWVNCVMFVLNR